jgi:hypothetical protein
MLGESDCHHCLVNACAAMMKKDNIADGRGRPVAHKSKSREPRSRKSPSDIELRIRQRAYQLYEQRGRVDGFALDDWLRAESEILGVQKQGKAKAARGSK